MFKTLRRVASYARPYMIYFILTVVFAAAGVALSLSVPVFIGEAVDMCVGKKLVDFDSLKKLTLILATIVILSGFFSGL